MKLHLFGKADAPLIVMLPGSFCPGETMAYLYTLLQTEYRICTVTYNGHHQGGKPFTTRQQEAGEIAEGLKEHGVSHIAMVYGQSMGSEVGAELIRQLPEFGITYGCAFFDGAPMIRLSKPYKAFMRFKFGMILRLIRNGRIDRILNMGIVKSMTAGDGGSLRKTIAGMQPTACCLNKQSLANVVECCYTFDYPLANRPETDRWYFLYAKEEKACKICLKPVQKAYPRAGYSILEGYGHLTYSLRNTEEYAALLQSWLKRHNA